MASLDHMSEDARNDFMSSLDQDRRQHFLALERAINDPKPTLRWYHHVGQVVNFLRGPSERFEYGMMRRLAEATPVSRDALSKSLAFFRMFPKLTDLAELEQLGVSWSLVVASMPLGDRAAQLAILREAAEKGWSSAHLEREVRLRRGERRPRRAGRRPDPASDAPEVEVQVLLDRVRTLGRYLEARWLQGESATLPRLRQTRRRPSAALRKSLTQADAALATLAGQFDRLRREIRQAAENGRAGTES